MGTQEIFLLLLPLHWSQLTQRHHQHHPTRHFHRRPVPQPWIPMDEFLRKRRRPTSNSHLSQDGDVSVETVWQWRSPRDTEPYLHVGHERRHREVIYLPLVLVELPAGPLRHLLRLLLPPSSLGVRESQELLPHVRCQSQTQQV